MNQGNGPVIDMTLEGDFPERPKPSLGAIMLRLAAFALLLGFGALAFWLAVFTVPVLIVAGLVCYGLFRLQMARHGVRFRPIIVRTTRR
ncbi:hypothetical protein AiwAL_09535 [Acidiphilium sp. AL]|uniref:Uncharacterized protein n=1 Tax=Acidiphilium iwatense TaxID=768198 RepID=A0ABS9DW48_9PROT|nr:MULTISPECIES: hypothetical protein [Acidiphilium]MCF3946971.1 hypothetical protein [Acidiphilium iwatense]MCU4160353.1 hypothetical protein [Acidiphilium sp. AL]